MRKFLVLFATVLVLGCSFSTDAFAYWDYQGNLPMGDGTRTFKKHEYLGSPQYYYPEVRMSWTTGSHYMRFVRVLTDGSWQLTDVTPGGGYCTFGTYDCARAWVVNPPMDGYGNTLDWYGCQNPGGLATVWVNCRATPPL